jgi:ABC-type lipoprotein export system ATPase subunit
MNDMQRGVPSPALRLEAIGRTYSQGHRTIDVFKNLSLDVYPGEVVALVGHSGTGKSSLLHIAGLLEKPTAGHVFVAGQNCTQLEDNATTRVRRLGIGFVYQFHHLLPEFSALENVVMPQLIAGVQGRCRGARQPSAGPAGAVQAGRSPPGGVVRRGAAARGDCPGAGQPSVIVACRRAHG